VKNLALAALPFFYLNLFKIKKNGTAAAEKIIKKTK
jgi:hypothetical protein